MLRKIRKKYPHAKQILVIAGVGAFIAASLVAPGLPRLLKGRRIDWESLLTPDEWEKFDERRLRENLKNMSKRRLVKILKQGDQHIVQITEKGKRRLLKYNLKDMKIPTPEKWDRMWRIVTYDVPEGKNAAREAIRSTLKRLNFLQLQKSVYLYPHPCQDVIDYLRELYSVGENVTLLTVGQLEGEEAYREYFDL